MPSRVLQISDIHFGGENQAAVEAAGDYVRASPFDLLVISGDITLMGHANEFEAATAWLERLPGPWISTPGNHDTPWMGLTDRLFRPWDAYTQAVGPVEGSFSTPSLAVEAINTARGWQIRLNWSKGEVSRRQARHAARRLQGAPREATRILVCHHPLVEAVGEPMTARVRGGKSAAAIFAAAEVDLILTGHLHAPFVQAIPFGDARTYGVGAGTLSLRERGTPPSFNVIETDSEKLVVTSMAWENGGLSEHRRWSMPLRPRRRPAEA